MGAASRRTVPGLTDADRREIAVRALRDGTAARLCAELGWSRADLARACNVSTHLLAGWEAGRQHPSDASALKLWHVLADACRTPPSRAAG